MRRRRRLSRFLSLKGRPNRNVERSLIDGLVVVVVAILA